MSGDASGPGDWPQMIKDCQQRESKLSDWERTFIDSVEDRLAKGQGLTPNQVARLDEIWEKVT
jgi:hypothetical protein